VNETTAVAGPPGWLMSIAATYFIVWSIFGIAFVIGVIYIVLKVKRLVAQTSKQVKQVTDPMMKTVSDVRGRVERISETVETTVTGVARKVDAASSTAAAPAAVLAAFVSGLRKGASNKGTKPPADLDDAGET
jgi:uncharacterized protein YoxC